MKSPEQCLKMFEEVILPEIMNAGQIEKPGHNQVASIMASLSTQQVLGQFLVAHELHKIRLMLEDALKIGGALHKPSLPLTPPTFPTSICTECGTQMEYINDGERGPLGWQCPKCSHVESLS